ncbi:hypothetical protein BDC45DRAFT_536112 [Circinella umbellata]|nr:hypothetical protein BDC45DRAFT_536112 [Circinella umbellata]
MGQHGSKFEEPFAFTGNHDFDTIILQGNEQEEKERHDTILDNPDFYNLEQGTKLAQDLEYIDQTYYDHQERQRPKEEYTEAISSGAATISIRSSPSRRRQSQELRAEGLQEVIVDHRTMPTVAMDLTGRSLVRLGAGIGSLTTLTQLNLSHNQIRTLPKELGNLTHLRVLNISYNRITTLPRTIGRLSRLRAFNASFNQLKTLPITMCHLNELMVFIVNNNTLQQLPVELGKLKRLATFHIAHNLSLTSIPAEIADMPSIKKLVAEDCGFPETVSLNLSNNPPSLVETCARQLVKMAIRNKTQQQHVSGTTNDSTLLQRIPQKFWPYLASVKSCSVCKGPYFDSFIRHHRIVIRSGIWITIEYKLCSSHWSTDDDRLLYTFGYRSQIMQDGLVNAFSHEMQRKLYLVERHEEEHVHNKNINDEKTEDEYYYCRLVPSHSDSLDSMQLLTTPTQISGQKGGSMSGPSSSLHLFATRYL